MAGSPVEPTSSRAFLRRISKDIRAAFLAAPDVGSL